VTTKAAARQPSLRACSACGAVAAFLPGDAITLLLETVPLYLLFELSVLLARVFEYRARRAAVQMYGDERGPLRPRFVGAARRNDPYASACRNQLAPMFNPLRPAAARRPAEAALARGRGAHAAGVYGGRAAAFEVIYDRHR